MSKETMERIVGRAVTNREYRERLLARPEEALEGYHLTDEEMCRVKSRGIRLRPDRPRTESGVITR